MDKSPILILKFFENITDGGSTSFQSSLWLGGRRYPQHEELHVKSQGIFARLILKQCNGDADLDGCDWKPKEYTVFPPDSFRANRDRCFLYPKTGTSDEGRLKALEIDIFDQLTTTYAL